ncbi:hypothetical protein D3C87_1871490 [compost metagenome]
MARRVASSAPARLSPSNRISPSRWALGGRRRSVDRAVIDLPEPLSPTSASVSPGAMSNDTSRAASKAPKLMVKSRTESRGAVKSIASVG